MKIEFAPFLRTRSDDLYSGSAYLFGVTTGNELSKLTASDAEAGDVFGYSVAISEISAIVGAEKDDDAGSQSGSTYLFSPEPSGLLLAAMGLLGIVTRRTRSEKVTFSHADIRTWYHQRF